jgi:hypothetical protein
MRTFRFTGIAIPGHGRDFSRLVRDLSAGEMRRETL